MNTSPEKILKLLETHLNKRFASSAFDIKVCGDPAKVMDLLLGASPGRCCVVLSAGGDQPANSDFDDPETIALTHVSVVRPLGMKADSAAAELSALEAAAQIRARALTLAHKDVLAVGHGGTAILRDYAGGELNGYRVTLRIHYALTYDSARKPLASNH